MKKVRHLRIGLRTIEYSVYALLTAYIISLAFVVFFKRYGIDWLFVLCFCAPLAYMWYKNLKTRFDKTTCLEKLNRKIEKDGMHARLPTAAERRAVKIFFETHKLEMPFLLMCDLPEEINSWVVRFERKNFLLITEQAYRKFTVSEMWAVIAHEMGHFENGDVVRFPLSRILLNISLLLSSLALAKIFLSAVFFPVELWFSPVLYPVILIAAFFFLWYGELMFFNILYLAREILADNTAAQTLGFAILVFAALRKMDSIQGVFLMEEREKALLWILKEDALKL